MADTAGWDASQNSTPTGSETIFPGPLAGLGASSPEKTPLDAGGADSQLAYQPVQRYSYFPASIQEIRESTTPAVNVVRQNPLLIRSNP